MSVEKALLFVFFRTGKGFSPTLTRNTYLFVPDRPGKPQHRKQRACNRILPTNVSGGVSKFPLSFLCWPTYKVKSKKIVLYKIKLFLCKVTRFKRYYK